MAENTATIEAPAAPAAPSSGASDPFESARLPGNEETPEVAPAKPEAEKPAEPEQPTPEAEAKPETPEATPAPEATKPAPVTEPKVWAGQFKTPEDLEIAYKYSSQEGKRLASALKEQAVTSAKENEALRDRVAEMEILAEAGPEMKEPSDEELEAMGPVKAMRLVNKIEARKTLLTQLKARNESRSKESKEKAAALESEIRDRFASMSTAKDQKSGEALFPDFDALQEDINSLMDFEPGIAGHRNSPIVAYFAAFGRRALERERAGKAKTRASSDAAALRAKAAGVGAGAAGAAGGGAKEPAAVSTGAKPGSDEEYNDNLVKAFGRHTVTL